jgi:hypothetical protein
MKLIKYNQTKISDEKTVPGLVRSQVEYEVKTAKGKLEYAGPKLSLQLWHQILSFFRWTYKEHSSECQVRLYVNLKLGRWAAWAFPQAARTGMTARELPVQETPEKARERFNVWGSMPSDDWLYFGTVHHHCSASAFQSSTDEQNEWNQDGLHITVGKMDQERHEVHARFYLDGNGFEPDLSCFWPLDPGLAEQVPAELHHQLAIHQMGEKVTVDFPDQWRHHLVETTPEPRSLVPYQRWDMDDLQLPMLTRADEALEDIHHQCGVMSVPEEEWLADLHNLAGNEVQQVILAACLKHQVTPDALLNCLSQSMLEY